MPGEQVIIEDIQDHPREAAKARFETALAPVDDGVFIGERVDAQVAADTIAKARAHAFAVGASNEVGEKIAKLELDLRRR